jgi:hypothetical protein
MVTYLITYKREHLRHSDLFGAWRTSVSTKQTRGSYRKCRGLDSVTNFRTIGRRKMNNGGLGVPHLTRCAPGRPERS